jgi:FkbM family methyltransferase
MGFYHFLPTEPWFNGVLEQLFRLKHGSMVDVGANLGQTLLRFKSLKNDAPYYGFEPNNGAYFYLSELVRINRFKNTFLFPVALTDATGITTFYRRHRTDVSSTIIRGAKAFTTAGNAIQVPAFKGDDVVAQKRMDTIAVIKVDVEGAELEVLRGFKHTLQTQQPFVICEILPVYHLDSENLRQRKKRQKILLAELKELHYVVYRIKSARTLQKIEKIEVHSNLSDSNYVFVPEALQKALPEHFKIV